MVVQEPRDQVVASTVGADVAFGPENLGLERAEIERRVDDALAAVNLEGRKDGRVDELSGGELARVAIAGALAMEPAHLVLDEPLAGLDATAREAVLDRLAALAASGTGVIVVSHDLADLIEPADRIVLLADGAVVRDGPPGEVLEALPAFGVRAPRC
jgi:biotin transport system ATP-binding protein